MPKRVKNDESDMDDSCQSMSSMIIKSLESIVRGTDDMADTLSYVLVLISGQMNALDGSFKILIFFVSGDCLIWFLSQLCWRLNALSTYGNLRKKC